MEVAASRYSIFRMFSMDARAIRAKLGTMPMARAMIQLVNPAPKVAETAMERMSPGMA